ncbi:hypothetical protein CMQ_4947 [Grosmannia clavigera kw1407]|uniref:Uncharacterized protein n=1 Tax=Grosmannia clavigera (strain kw1407 / UAMH 11150) TaxID=655863 RepID=F0XK73_GROCL|nr:uncharacterized protein CMQ_4947 [Grosmannia clavigera kw1407]EFX01876.1 hypothetical protein CMQ_4947 [Grosmannia clavigera kw1407]
MPPFSARSSSVAKQTVAADKALDAGLNIGEAHEAARLALQMVDESGQCLEVLTTAPPVGLAGVSENMDKREGRGRTSTRAEMLVQRLQRAELAVAQEAFVASTVPGFRGGLHLG